MSTIYTEGFDKYGPPGIYYPALATLLTQGAWTTINGPAGATNLVAGLSETGYALNFSGGANLYKTLPTNYSRLIGGFRFASNLLAANTGVVLQDGSTAQCSVIINYNSGYISLNQSNAGTAIAISTVSVTAGTTHYLEFDITIGSSGAYTIWLDGVQILSGTGNTKQSANSYMNSFGLTNNGNIGSAASITFDDIYLFNSSGSFCNAALNSNPRIETKFPSGDYQTQFTNSGNVLGINYAATNSQYYSTANGIYLRAYVPPVNCTINSISFLPETSNGTAKFIPVIYANSGGVPGSLMSAGSVVMGPSSGTILTMPLTTPQALTAGVTYWIGFLSDTNYIYLAMQDTTSNKGYLGSTTFTSGAPGTAPTMTSGLASILLYGNCSGATTNWESVASNPPGGIGSAIQSLTPGNEDLYTFPTLSTDIIYVYSVAVMGHAELSTAGTRTISLHTKSGTTDSSGSLGTVSLSNSFVWYASYFDTDPNTGAMWTTTNVNAAKYGPQLVS
jgi:hypothetical protein